jgi:PAS domain S-box-containing protein
LIGVDATPDFFIPLGQLWRQMLALGIATLLTVGTAGMLLIRQVSRRLGRLRDAVSRVTRGDFTARAGMVGRDEIGALCRDLDGMISSVVTTHAYYESVLASVDIALLTTDTKGQVVGANTTAARTFAASDQLVGLPIQEVLRTEPALASLVEKALSQRPATLVEEVPLAGGLAAGGRVVAAVISPMRQAGEWTGIALSLSDITDLRLLERRARTNDRLAALGSMAAGLFHEIRNPLASMMMYLDLLPSHIHGAEGEEILTRATATAERLANFLHDFQIFAGLRPLRREWIDATEVLDEAVGSIPWPPTITSLVATAIGPSSMSIAACSSMPPAICSKTLARRCRRTEERSPSPWRAGLARLSLRSRMTERELRPSTSIASSIRCSRPRPVAQAWA